MDFMSGVYFRVFENLFAENDDPARFKLEIVINNGAIVYADELDKIGDDHTIKIGLEKVYKQTLTLHDIDTFFKTLLDMQEGFEEKSGSSSTREDNVKNEKVEETKLEDVANKTFEDDYMNIEEV